MGRRITIEGPQLAAVLNVWLRKLPKWVWGTEPAYERLRKERRNDPEADPDPMGMVAELIAAELQRLDWQVSYEDRANLFADLAEPLRKEPGA